MRRHGIKNGSENAKLLYLRDAAALFFGLHFDEAFGIMEENQETLQCCGGKKAVHSK